MENENEVISSNSIDVKIEIDIKEEPWWLEEASTGAKPEPEEPLVSESEMNKIKVEAVEVPEIPHKRRNLRAPRRWEANSRISRMNRKIQSRREYYNSLMRLMEKEHEIKMEGLKMKREMLEMELKNQKLKNEIEQIRVEQRRKQKEIDNYRLLHLDLLKNKSE